MPNLKPNLSYTIWFSQRTGSTLLCKALEETGIAGKPNEWLNVPGEPDLLVHYQVDTHAELQDYLWQLGSTSNGVFGLKFGFSEPRVTHHLDALRQFPDCPHDANSRVIIWHHAFPNSRHIFMTRRNKIRQAVSWWKAIKTQEWHRENGATEAKPDLGDAYRFEAIDHLYDECSMREAGIQAFFSEGGIVPLTIVYEDFIETYSETIRQMLDFLGLDDKTVTIPSPYYVKLADEISEEWVQRFREEKQRGWQNRGW
ncbi:MAG: Stf0 family sulfotransferase [Chloroflexota bacterium]